MDAAPPAFHLHEADPFTEVSFVSLPPHALHQQDSHAADRIAMDHLLSLAQTMGPLLPPDVSAAAAAAAAASTAAPQAAHAPPPPPPRAPPPPTADADSAAVRAIHELDLELILFGARAPPPPPPPPRRRAGTTVLRAASATTACSSDFLRSVTFHDKNALAAPHLAYPCSPVTPPPPPPHRPAAELPPPRPPLPPLSPAGTPTRCSPGSRRVIRKPKTYAKPVASRFCHICSRMPRRGQGSAVCRNMQQGLCRKIVCERCIVEQGWNFGAIAASGGGGGGGWLCPHCTGVCPSRSQCHIYNRINARRKRSGDEAPATPPPAEARSDEQQPSQSPASPLSATLEGAKAAAADLAAPFAFLIGASDAVFPFDAEP